MLCCCGCVKPSLRLLAGVIVFSSIKGFPDTIQHGLKKNTWQRWMIMRSSCAVRIPWSYQIPILGYTHQCSYKQAIDSIWKHSKMHKAQRIVGGDYNLLLRRGTVDYFHVFMHVEAPLRLNCIMTKLCYFQTYSFYFFSTLNGCNFSALPWYIQVEAKNTRETQVFLHYIKVVYHILTLSLCEVCKYCTKSRYMNSFLLVQMFLVPRYTAEVVSCPQRQWYFLSEEIQRGSCLCPCRVCVPFTTPQAMWDGHKCRKWAWYVFSTNMHPQWALFWMVHGN